jgi:hypothetical protein
MPGMLTISSMRVIGSNGTDMLALRGREILPIGPYSLPDLTDPATLGCLLALVREAYRLRLWLASSRDGDRWYVDAASGTLAHGKTEGEALVTALEAAND